VQYLSSEWIAAANTVVEAAARTAPVAPVVIDQYVDGATNYRVMIERDACSIVSFKDPPPGPPDASFRQNIETARAVAQRTTDAHQAFLLGHIRFEGNSDLLIERRDAFRWLEATLAPLLAKTTWAS
jgi:hypothetical protein